MNDEQFEDAMRVLEETLWPSTAEKIRARDTAQREALAQMQSERDQYDELHQDSIALSARLEELHQEELASVEAERDHYFRLHGQESTRLEQKCGELAAALARVEADNSQLQLIVNSHANMRDTAQAQLAEALLLIRDAKEGLRTGPDYGWEDRLANQLGEFLARHAQAEQQEARDPVLARLEHGVSLDEAMALTMDRYDGALDKLAASEQQYSQGAQQEAQGAQAGEFWAWLDLAYRDGSKGECRNFTKHNMEVAYRAGAEAARAALATQPAVQPNANEFHQGIFYAVAELQRSFDMTTMCAAILRAAGIDDEDCSEVDEFDKVSLREIAEMCGLGLTGLDSQTAMRGAEYE